MSSRNLASNYERGCVSGLFGDDSSAERAIDNLKKAGFSRDHISIATAGEQDRKSDFWDKVNDMLGKDNHAEPSATLKDSLTQCGMDDATAEYFDDSLETGKVLVTVVADSVGTVKAREIMQAAGADLGEAAVGAIRREPVHRERETAGRPIQLRGEVLRAVKERVPTGETRLRKEIVTENKHIEVPVEKENLVVERRPGSGQEASGPVGEDSREVRIPVSEERVRVEKKPVVNEEVRVRKEPVVETKRVDAEVKHEELRTEKEGKPIRGDKDKAA